MPLLDLKSRSTPDVVVIMLSALVGTIIVIELIIIFVIALWGTGNPDITGALKGISDIINTLVGAIIGFVAGRKLPDGEPPKSE